MNLVHLKKKKFALSGWWNLWFAQCLENVTTCRNVRCIATKNGPNWSFIYWHSQHFCWHCSVSGEIAQYRNRLSALGECFCPWLISLGFLLSQFYNTCSLFNKKTSNDLFIHNRVFHWLFIINHAFLFTLYQLVNKNFLMLKSICFLETLLMLIFFFPVWINFIL